MVIMPRRIVWPKVKKIWWCPSCNIPSLESVCPKCNGKTNRVQLSDPGDARPAFERDYRTLYSAYVFEFGTSKGLNDVLGRSIALLNKAPYYDEMKEIVVDGAQIGRVFFDPLLRRWRFRLSRYSAIKLFTSHPDVLEVVKLDKKWYRHGDIVRVSRDIEVGKQVVLLGTDGSVSGIGYSKGGGRIMIHSWWGKPSCNEIKLSVEPRSKTDLNDVIQAHRVYMNILTSRSKKFIATIYERMRKPLIVSFSGGKDSLVSLHLSLDLGLQPSVLFNNTGIELPETVETVYKTVDKYGLELVEASAEEKFWDSVYRLGVPGRDYRWCCKVCKLAPLALTVKDRWADGGLNIVGQRAFESIDRARNPRLWRLRWAPTLLNLSPINEWSQFEVWLYIFMNKLEPNPLYFMGYERIGCFMCPASTMAELELVSQTHREIWGRWLEVLEFWAKRLGLPREWIDYGLWRWNTPARYRTMLAKRLGVASRVNDWAKSFKGMTCPGIERSSIEEGRVFIVLEKDIAIAHVVDQLTALNYTNYRIDSDTGILTIEWINTVVEVRGRTITASYQTLDGIEKAIDVLKLIYRWNQCTGCRSCEAVCPSGAASVTLINGRPRPSIDKSKCIRCKFCVYNCPIAEVYVEHVVTPIIFGDPEAWRRKTREHHAEVLEKMREFIKSMTPDTQKRSIESRELGEERPIDIFRFFQI